MTASGASLQQQQQQQAVILAGGGGSRLFPLNAAGLPKVLMPVANRPLITFPLRSLVDAGVTEAVLVCEGDAAASAVRSWASQQPASGLRLEIVRVPEGVGSVAALRHALDRIHSENFILLSGDVVTEVPLRAMLLAHQLKGSSMTALFGRRPSPAADTQPGKAPRGVDYVGLAGEDRLAFYLHSPEAVKELKVPSVVLRRQPALALTTRLVDMQVLVLSTGLIRTVLELRPDLVRLEEHLLPYLVRHQDAPSPEISAAMLARATSSALASDTSSSLSNLHSIFSSLNVADDATSAPAASTAGVGTAADNNNGMARAQSLALSSPDVLTLGGSGKGGATRLGWLCTVYIAPEGSYCRRANSLQGYADANREVVTPQLALKLLGEAPSARGENFIAPNVSLGNKITVGAGCMCGEGSSLGDKCSVKRSVIGRGCKLGNNVKVINSVLMDGVEVGDNCHIHNSIVSQGCVLQPGAQIKDCQLAPGYTVPAGADVKGEVLANK